MTPTLLVCSLDDAEIDTGRCRAVLSAAERQRIERLRSPWARARATVARGLLRLELGERLGCAPGAIRFALGPAGKPALAAGDACHFNVSHSHGRVVVAVAPEAPVGVDVEWRERRTRIDALARQCYATNERAGLEALPGGARRYRFFQLWTLKEAVTKALGRGLWGTLAGIRIDAPPAGPAELRLDGALGCEDPVGWWHFDLGAGYSLALAHLADDATLPHVCHITPDGERAPWPREADLAGVRPVSH